MDIRFIPQEEIDKQLYNSCVHYATNGSLYGYDWYLNATAKEWDLLVEGDNYVSAMPLPKRRNWLGRTYLTQPTLVPDLAVYSVKPLSPKRIQAFWDAIPESYRGGNLTVEPASVPGHSGRFTVTAARGEALFLNQSYEEITDAFPPGYYDRMARAEAADLLPVPVLKPEAFAEFWLSVHGSGGENEWKFHAMQRIMYQILHRSWGNATGVQTRDGELLAVSFNAYSHGRVFPLFRAESARGADAGAMTLLYDTLLRSHAGRSLKVELLP
ncbi:hypothetical protein GGR26_000164 [Lewinella marina]|uniref:Uncharacterized protein n=1 Tax=Neolewinella marina TaxID=438751 RepID=A0A2G0CK94_9BACT|nr:hypothetical protein [Neolewinella marina]NJB84419.1 hypothetical protein [Neolewinella marina]PHL00389.1 hypothetical protein CGL56_04965 [Neolewinella marina]